MTFLELVQRFREEAGISGTGPTTVIGQAGQMKMCVNWILRAYQDIQNLHARQWNFLRQEFSFNTIYNTQNYTPAAVTLPELSTWVDDSFRFYLTSTGYQSEQWLYYTPWRAFREDYMFGAIRTQIGVPMYFTIKPDKSLSLWQIPDAIYTIVGEYYMRAQTMTANADEPIIPEEYQMIIVYRAMMMYAAKVAAPEIYANGKNEYDKLLSELETNELPEIEMAGALA